MIYMVTYPNWTALFSGFDGLGTAIGDFVTNLFVSLLPMFIILAVIALILGVLTAVTIGVVYAIQKAMKGMGHRK